jgi:hypothetical protein
MSVTVGHYPDVEGALGSWISANFHTMPGGLVFPGPSEFPGVGSLRCVTELPADLAAEVPLVEVARIGGGDLNHSIDAATVDITCYHSTRGAARALALLIRSTLRDVLPGQPLDGGIVLRVNTSSGPHWLPYADTAVRRFTALYQIVLSTHL